jgi:hypothetical protein
MKKRILLFSATLLVTFIIISVPRQQAISNNSGAPAAHTGSPADGMTCAMSGCHTGSAVAAIPGIITSNVPANGYIPGQTYAITATVTQAGINKFGFQISPQSTTGLLRGTLAITSPTTTKIVSSKYVTHTSGGTAATSNTRTWSFNWTAPVAGTGAVTFYGAFNYANGNSTSSGDQIKTSTLVIPEDLSSGIAANENDPLFLTCWPNPVQERFILGMQLATDAFTRVTLCDLRGAIAANLFEGQLATGAHKLQLSVPSTVSKGLYFVRVETGNVSSVTRMVKL